MEKSNSLRGLLMWLAGSAEVGQEVTEDPIQQSFPDIHMAPLYLKGRMG